MAETSPTPFAGWRPPVPPMNTSVPPARTLAAPYRATPTMSIGCSCSARRPSSKSISASGA